MLLQRSLRKQGLKRYTLARKQNVIYVAKKSKKTRIETRRNETTVQFVRFCVAKKSKKTRIETLLPQLGWFVVTQLQRSLRKQGLKPSTMTRLMFGLYVAKKSKKTRIETKYPFLSLSTIHCVAKKSKKTRIETKEHV